MTKTETYGMETKNCPNCLEDFFRKPSEMKRCTFCSVPCRVEFTRKSRKTICKTCGIVFFPEKRRNKKDPQFCSQACMGSNYATLDYEVSFLKQSVDFIDGFLLGDGHISKHNCHISWSLKYQEFSEFIENKLNQYLPKSSRRFVKDARFKNGGSFSTRGNTKCHPDFKQQRARWYPQGKKNVPKDVSLSPESVLIWYLGDGSAKKYSVTLCTNGFTQECVRFLIKRLSLIGIPSKMLLNNQQPIIVISSSVTKLFFDYIGWESPVRCYDYKFDTYQHRDSSYGAAAPWNGFDTNERDMSKPQ